MKTPEEKRWELMRQVLLAESRGDEPHNYSSGRTLFGIKSHAEEVMERVAAEDETRCLELMQQRREEEKRRLESNAEGTGEGALPSSGI